MESRIRGVNKDQRRASKNSRLHALLVVTIDEAIATNDVWFNVGLQKRSCNPQLTLHDGKDAYYASGLTLDDFLRECEGL